MAQGIDTGPPAVDSTRNKSFTEVIGNKNDTHAGTSVMAFVNRIDDHTHKEAKVYPTLADGVLVTATSNDWTDLGAYAEIVATNGIALPFDIHFINVEAVSANGQYELVLYAITTEIGRVRFGKTTQQDGPQSIPIQTPIIAANSQIQAKIASDNGAADTARISLGYHVY